MTVALALVIVLAELTVNQGVMELALEVVPVPVLIIAVIVVIMNVREDVLSTVIRDAWVHVHQAAVMLSAEVAVIQGVLVRARGDVRVIAVIPAKMVVVVVVEVVEEIVQLTAVVNVRTIVEEVVKVLVKAHVKIHVTEGAEEVVRGNVTMFVLIAVANVLDTVVVVA